MILAVPCLVHGTAFEYDGGTFVLFDDSPPRRNGTDESHKVSP